MSDPRRPRRLVTTHVRRSISRPTPQLSEPEVQALAQRVVLQIQQTDVWAWAKHKMIVAEVRHNYKPLRAG